MTSGNPDFMKSEITCCTARATSFSQRIMDPTSSHPVVTWATVDTSFLPHKSWKTQMSPNRTDFQFHRALGQLTMAMAKISESGFFVLSNPGVPSGTTLLRREKSEPINPNYPLPLANESSPPEASPSPTCDPVLAPLSSQLNSLLQKGCSLANVSSTVTVELKNTWLRGLGE